MEQEAKRYYWVQKVYYQHVSKFPSTPIVTRMVTTIHPFTIMNSNIGMFGEQFIFDWKEISLEEYNLWNNCKQADELTSVKKAIIEDLKTVYTS